MRSAHFFETLNVIQHKKSVTVWHPPCRTISSRNSRTVDIVPVSPWVGVIVSVRASGCLCLGPCMYWIQNSRTETRTLFGFCLYQGCFIPPPIVSVMLPLMFLKTKNKKMTDDSQQVCSAGVPMGILVRKDWKGIPWYAVIERDWRGVVGGTLTLWCMPWFAK